jgi:hypothetical protein
MCIVHTFGTRTAQEDHLFSVFEISLFQRTPSPAIKASSSHIERGKKKRGERKVAFVALLADGEGRGSCRPQRQQKPGLLSIFVVHRAYMQYLRCTL